MNQRKLTAAIAIAIASLACAGVASAEDCAEKATRLKTEVDARPASDGQARLSRALGAAADADETRCEEIMARVQDRLQAAREGHASAGKPMPNYPNAPSDTAAGPEMNDTAGATTDEEGHASEADPIPNQPSGDAPAATGPGGADSTSGSELDEATTGHASGDDPVPNESANADDDSDAEGED